jgi:hypothetical protein
VRDRLTGNIHEGSRFGVEINLRKTDNSVK